MSDNQENLVQLLPKQGECWAKIHDKVTTEILYGGGVGGGKSYLMCVFIASHILQYPGSRIALCREELKKLKLSTLKTLIEVFEIMGIQKKSYKYNENMGTIKLINGSEIVLVDLSYRPSDPDYAYLGSSEYTVVCIDEAQEIDGKAKETILSRIRLLKSKVYYKAQTKKAVEDWIEIFNKKNNQNLFLNEVSITGFVIYEAILWKKEKPILLMGCNPGKNFLYKEFYFPNKKGELPDFRAFIQALPADNPFLDKSYIKSLYNMEEERKQRLVHGNWEFNEDDSYLFSKPVIIDMFTRSPQKGETYYITGDVARQGKDDTIIMIWRGLHCFEIHTLSKETFARQKTFILEKIKKYSISIENVILDGAGLGIGLVEMVGCRGFIGNSKPFSPYSSKIVDYHKRNYSNLRSQCYFYLQKLMKDGNISVNTDADTQEKLLEELLFIKQANIEDDVKASIEKKSEIKSNLGRSPDLSDCISMRAYFIVKNLSYGNVEEEIQEETGNFEKKSEIHKKIDQYLKFEDEPESEPLEISAF